MFWLVRNTIALWDRFKTSSLACDVDFNRNEIHVWYINIAKSFRVIFTLHQKMLFPSSIECCHFEHVSRSSTDRDHSSRLDDHMTDRLGS